MNNLQDVLKKIKDLTDIDLQHKNTSVLFFSLLEEIGELSTEIKIEDKVFGNSHKQPGEDGSIGEAVDVIIMALSIYFARNKNVNLDNIGEELAKRIFIKLSKWEKNQKN